VNLLWGKFVSILAFSRKQLRRFAIMSTCRLNGSGDTFVAPIGIFGSVHADTVAV
jgi:hypothetical protein